MSEEQLQELLQQIPPEVILMIIQMVLNASPEELKQLIQELQQASGNGGQGIVQGQQPQDGQGRGQGGEGRGQGQDNIFG